MYSVFAWLIENLHADGCESLAVDLDIFEGVEVEGEFYFCFIAHPLFKYYKFLISPIASKSIIL